MFGRIYWKIFEWKTNYRYRNIICSVFQIKQQRYNARCLTNDIKYIIYTMYLYKSKSLTCKSRNSSNISCFRRFFSFDIYLISKLIINISKKKLSHKRSQLLDLILSLKLFFPNFLLFHNTDPISAKKKQVESFSYFSWHLGRILYNAETIIRIR